MLHISTFNIRSKAFDNDQNAKLYIYVYIYICTCTYVFLIMYIYDHVSGNKKETIVKAPNILIHSLLIAN